MQGENLAPLECSVQVDMIGKECLKEKKNLYFYRNSVEIPPLSMVDDLLSLSKCGLESVRTNAFINAKSNMKRFQFGESKCHKIHVGKKNTNCPSLWIDKWKVKPVDKVNIDVPSIEDVYDGVHNIDDEDNQRYLGDIIGNDGKNDLNIKARVSKGIGIIKQISSILSDICFGNNYFKVAKILRESLFLNSILLNIEVSYNVTQRNINEL